MVGEELTYEKLLEFQEKMEKQDRSLRQQVSAFIYGKEREVSLEEKVEKARTAQKIWEND